MMPRDIGLRFWLVGAASVLAFVACAEADAHDGPVGEDAGVSVIPDAEAPEADPPVDGGADAPPDATRTCSDDNFCHTAVPSDEVFHGVWGDGAGVVWAVTESGRIFRWDGASWTIHTEKIGASFRAIWGSGPTDIWAVGVSGVMHGTGASSASITFTPVDVPGDPTVPFNALWGRGPDDVWAVGGTTMKEWPNEATSRAVHYTGSPESGGHGWEVASLPDGIDYQGIWGSPGAGVWVRGAHEPADETGWSQMGVVWRLPPGATNWESVDVPWGPPTDWQPRPGEITAGALSGDSSVWLAGASQSKTKVYWHGTSADGGQSFTWTCIPRDPDPGLTEFWGMGSDDTWAAGEYGRLRHWDGKRWKQAAIMVTAIPVKKAFHGIWGLGNDDFWVVGDGIALHKTAVVAP